MSKGVKELLVGELTKRLEGVKELVVVSTKGMSAQETVRFRSALRQKKARALMVKNAMCARAFEALGLAYAQRLLDGPTTLVFGGEGLAEITKLLMAQGKVFKKLEVRGAASEGQLLSAKDVEAMSKLPGRAELVGRIIGGLLSPTRSVIGALMAPAQQVASQIGKLADKEEAKAA